MTMTNGTIEKKSLQSQLDRFDRILDGLADGLNDAVAMAVKETVDHAVRESIHDGFRALASDSALATALRETGQPPAELVFDDAPITPAKPSRLHTCQSLLTEMRRRVTQCWNKTRTLAALVWHYCRRVLAVLLMIVLLCLGGYVAGPVLCGAFLAGLLVSAGIVVAWQRWRQPSAPASQCDTCRPMPELATSPTPVDASAAAV